MSGARPATLPSWSPNTVAARPSTAITPISVNVVATIRLRSQRVSHVVTGSTSIASIKPAVSGIMKLRPHHSETMMASVASTMAATLDVGRWNCASWGGVGAGIG